MPDAQKISDYEITEAMIQMGGSFVRLLGKLWRVADTDNRARLKATFPEYWERYAEFAKGFLDSRLND